VSGAGSAVALDSTWSPTVDLTTTPGNAIYPQIAIDNTGLATAIWMRFDGTNYIVQTRTSRNGEEWSPVVDLSVAGGNAFNPHVTVDSNGLATAIWVRDNGSNTIVQTRNSLNGAPWSSVVDLSAIGGNSDWPQITADAKGLATAIWTHFDGSNTIIQTSTSQNGASWTPVADLSDTGGDADLPQIVADANGLALAIWQRYDGSNFAIQARTSQDGAAWAPVVDLSSGAGYADDPHVTIDTSGLATAIWTHSDGSNAILQTRASRNGAGWSPVIDLSATGGDAFNPQVTAGVNGLTTAIWTYSGGSDTVVQTSASLYGATWSPVTDLSMAGGDARGAQVTVNTNGLANAIWVRDDGTNSVVQTSTSLKGEPWSPVVDLSSSPRDANFPQIKVGTNGLALAIWARSDGRDSFVQIRSLQEEIPVVTPTDPATLAKTGRNESTLFAGVLALVLVIAGFGMHRRRHPKAAR
jgi:hypothetical protein